MTKRGGLFTVSLPVDYGKPRPALVIQNDLLNELDSLVLCPVSSDLRTADFRVTVEPSAENGLRQTSQVMVDKLSTLPRHKVGETFGRLEIEKMRAVDRAMMLVIGVI
jgi:mRNA interferase MazF